MSDPTLAWSHTPDDPETGPGYWIVDGDEFLGMCVMANGELFEWFVGGKSGVEPTVADAQTACERAALGLLVGALAAFPLDADWHIVTADPTFGMCVEAVNLERDNYGGAISLARALIAAGVAARGGG